MNTHSHHRVDRSIIYSNHGSRDNSIVMVVIVTDFFAPSIHSLSRRYRLPPTVSQNRAPDKTIGISWYKLHSFCLKYFFLSLGPFYGAIAVPSVTRCRRRCCCCGHRRAAARSGEWAQRFSNASCLSFNATSPARGAQMRPIARLFICWLHIELVIGYFKANINYIALP